jgi:type II secretory pathway component PulM
MSCTAEFVVHQNLYKPVERKLFVPEPEAIERAARASAGAEGLELRRIEIRGGDVYAELCSPVARPSASR